MTDQQLEQYMNQETVYDIFGEEIDEETLKELLQD